MKINSQVALDLLKELSIEPDNPPLRHMICVGDAAAKIATALNQNGQNLDVDKVRTLGYLHDIGKLVGPINQHIVNGYLFLQERNFPAEFCNICLTHSFPSNDAHCILSTPPDPVSEKLVIDFLPTHQQTFEEKLIALCDLMCKYEVMTMEKRMIDIIRRYGTWEGTQKCVNAALELKVSIDQLLGKNLYSLFPELRENL